MESYIVRIRSFYLGKCIRCGTGIVIGSRDVLTATHVACGDQHLLIAGELEMPMRVTQQNDSSVILQSEELIPIESAQIFSCDEILDSNANWEILGYITAEQSPHMMAGRGFIYVKTEDNQWNYNLKEIESGYSQNYEGLSGSPVLSCGRIVGILQVQAHDADGSLGVRMASAEMFQELLSTDNFSLNEYELSIYQACQAFSHRQIGKNKASRKYIPDIFVEEGFYKEHLRYFADPVLFVKKTLLECRRLDFSSLNRYLKLLDRPLINISSLPESVSPESLDSTVAVLSTFLSKTINVLETIYSYIERDSIGNEQYFEIRSTLNTSLKFDLQDMLDSIRFTGIRYLLLTKLAGQGKTNFLCDFTENFLLKKGYCVLYFNANEFHEPPMRTIQRKLSQNGQYDPAYAYQVLERSWKRTRRPLVIVIDGLNENTVYPNFGNTMCGFLEQCETLPFIKVIMSTRKELLVERFGTLLQCQEHLPFCHFDMRTMDDQFTHRIFWGYLNFFDIDIRWDTLTTTTFDKLTEDVLLLRFFCEANEHKRQLYMYDVYKYAVFEEYCKKKAQEYQQDSELIDAGELFYTLLDFICNYMLEHKKYLNVPLQAFTMDQQRLLQKMVDNDVIFKSEDEILHGIHQRKGTVVSFTFDEFRDYCLTNHILSYYYERERFFNIWNNLRQEHSIILEGVQKYVFYLSKAKYADTLLPLVQELPEYEELYWTYIWDVEDDSITAEDLAQWKNQMLISGPYAENVVYHLVFRDDLTYFTHINIMLLFETLDELLNTLNQYSTFIKYMFGAIAKDKYGYPIGNQHKSIFPINQLLEELHKWVLSPEECLQHQESYRLSIYLYDLSAAQTQKIWNELYQTAPESAVGLLCEMNVHPSSSIRGNVKEIISMLPRRSDAYDQKIMHLDNTNKFGENLPSIAQSILDIFS